MTVLPKSSVQQEQSSPVLPAASHSGDAPSGKAPKQEPHPHRHGHHHAVKKRAATTVILQMLGCVIGIFASFMIWSVKQERVATRPYTMDDGTSAVFRSPLLIVASQSFFASLVGIALLKGSGESLGAALNPNPPGRRSAVLQRVFGVGFCCAFASPFGYAAMRRLSYPIVLTTKMCKMVPVILMGTFWYRVRYTREKYLVVALITVGVLAFSVLEERDERRESGRSSSLFGLLLVLINLIMDGMMCATQDHLVKGEKWSGNRIMVFTNLSCFAWTAAALVALEFAPASVTSTIQKAELSDAVSFFQGAPEALWDIAVMGVLNAVGQFFVFQTVALFDTLTVTAMTLLRKVGSVLASIYVHEHQLSGLQWAALSVVMAGIVLETRINIREKSKKSS